MLLLSCLQLLFTSSLFGIEPVFSIWLCFDLLFLQCTLNPKAVMHDKSYSNTNIFKGLVIVQKETLAFIKKKYVPILLVGLQLTTFSYLERIELVRAAVK